MSRVLHGPGATSGLGLPGPAVSAITHRALRMSLALRSTSTPITSSHNEITVGPMIIKRRDVTVGVPVNACKCLPALIDPRPASAAVHPNHAGKAPLRATVIQTKRMNGTPVKRKVEQAAKRKVDCFIGAHNAKGDGLAGTPGSYSPAISQLFRR